MILPPKRGCNHCKCQEAPFKIGDVLRFRGSAVRYTVFDTRWDARSGHQMRLHQEGHDEPFNGWDIAEEGGSFELVNDSPTRGL